MLQCVIFSERCCASAGVRAFGCMCAFGADSVLMKDSAVSECVCFKVWNDAIRQKKRKKRKNLETLKKNTQKIIDCMNSVTFSCYIF